MAERKKDRVFEPKCHLAVVSQYYPKVACGKSSRLDCNVWIQNVTCKSCLRAAKNYSRCGQAL